jgi:hypothetical protein
MNQDLMGKQQGSKIIRFDIMLFKKNVIIIHCLNIVNLGLGTHFATDELSPTLRSVFFSVIMGETTDVTVDKQLIEMVEFYDVVKGKTVEELYYNLVQCEEEKSKSLVENLLELFERKNSTGQAILLLLFEASYLPRTA